MSSRKYFLVFLILYSLLSVSLSYEDRDIEGKSLSRQKKALLYPQFTLLQVRINHTKKSKMTRPQTFRFQWLLLLQFPTSLLTELP